MVVSEDKDQTEYEVRYTRERSTNNPFNEGCIANNNWPGKFDWGTAWQMWEDKTTQP